MHLPVNYDTDENELTAINNRIARLKTIELIEISEKNIKELRKAIEEYFEEMNN